MKIPRAIQNLIESFERLPGIGPKTAQRLTFYLLHVPQHELDLFANSLTNLKSQTKLCSTCFNIDETDPCSICADSNRDTSVICVVEDPLDVLALERSGKLDCLYHVLHGKIDPLNNIGPDEIYIKQLLDRVKGEGPPAGEAGERVREIILATNPTMEGEATAMYIVKQLKAQNAPARNALPEAAASLQAGTQSVAGGNLKITRIGRGLPTGADLEYADDVTLERAMEGRSEY